MEISRDLLEALAPAEPINNDEMGGCIFCFGHPPKEKYGYARAKLSDHKSDCSWVEARRLLGDEWTREGA